MERRVGTVPRSIKMSGLPSDGRKPGDGQGQLFILLGATMEVQRRVYYRVIPRRVPFFFQEFERAAPAVPIMLRFSSFALPPLADPAPQGLEKRAKGYIYITSRGQRIPSRYSSRSKNSAWRKGLEKKRHGRKISFPFLPPPRLKVSREKSNLWARKRKSGSRVRGAVAREGEEGTARRGKGRGGGWGWKSPLPLQ